ncbi:MAG TPA: hypothetical protein VLA20_11260, partial [Vicinamibacterales bacterium]|nr:hypothetical protein [Vicinamibacterales bacterium]
LPKKAGLNRFVWNMRYPTIPGVPGVYIEASYNGHKAPPGRYRMTIRAGDRTASTTAEILPNPLYSVTPEAYREYHQVMTSMERDLTVMHEMVNDLHAKRAQIEALLDTLPADAKFASVKRDGAALVETLKAWDADMVSRRSRAYDDVENYAQKFTANFMFLVNQTESDLPRVNQSSLDQLEEMSASWTTLRTRGEELQTREIPSLNRRLWELGIGAIWRK